MVSEWIFELGGELPQLAQAELTELLATTDCELTVTRQNELQLRCILVRSVPPGLLARLGMVRSGGVLAAEER